MKRFFYIAIAIALFLGTSATAKDLIFKSPERHLLDNFRFAYTAPTDWDGDGLTDLIVGFIKGNAGYVSLYKNIGSKNTPVFSKAGIPLKTDDGKLIVSGSS